MASTSGLGAVTTGGNLAADILGHITPASATSATAVTVTGPLKVGLYTTVSTNTTPGTECSDANYLRIQGSVTAWNAVTTTAGAGYQVGYAQRTSNIALTYGGGTGFAVAQTFAGVVIWSSDATPCCISYQNYSSAIVVPVNNQYNIASASVVLQLS